MKRIWAPWRMEFILAGKKSGKCIFCDLPERGVNDKNLVLWRGKKAFVILNRYPYSNGHLMVVPYRHLSDPAKLSDEEHVEIGHLVSKSLGALKKAVHAQGFNVGLNLGEAAGAGIKDHLHYHLVPRWKGDSNFMPVLGDVRVMPEHLKETYRLLKKHF